MEEYIQRCMVCQQTSYMTCTIFNGFITTFDTPNEVWEDILMDFIKRFSKSKGNIFIFALVDRGTKYAHFGAFASGFMATQVAELFMKIVVKHLCFPRSIVSDRDRIFLSLFWKSLMGISGTMLHRSTSYYP